MVKVTLSLEITFTVSLNKFLLQNNNDKMIYIINDYVIKLCFLEF